MKRVVCALVFVLVPHILFAQPNVSGQCHWTPSTLDLENPVTGHTHLDVKCEKPPYSEFNAPIACRFTIKLFQTEGVSADFFAGVLQGHSARNIIWDDTGTSTAPVRRGDPGHHALKAWSGSFIVDPDPLFPHGWMNIAVSTATFYDNGDSQRINTLVPYFSTFDLSQPLDWNPPMMAARCGPFSPRRPDVLWGANQMDVPGFNAVPFTLNLLHSMTVSPVRYGTLSSLPPAVFELRRDLDLHNDVPGVLLQTVTNPPDSFPSGLDPALMGGGLHKLAFILTQPDGGIEQVASLLVVDVDVDGTAPPPPPPPPPTCLPPAVLVNGQCVITPPPPLPPPSTLVPPLTMTVCDSSAPPKCSTVVVKD